MVEKGRKKRKNLPFLSKSFSVAAQTRKEAENMNCSKPLALAAILAKTRKGRRSRPERMEISA